jgi:hypothetical protein
VGDDDAESLDATDLRFELLDSRHPGILSSS